MNNLPSFVREKLSAVQLITQLLCLHKHPELPLAVKSIWVQKLQIYWELNYIVTSE